MIHFENQSGIITISIDTNESNSFDLNSFRELNERLDAAYKENGKVLILRSSRPKVFSQGLNLSQLNGEKDESVLRTFLGYFYEILQKIYFFPAPVIAELGGHAMGYGAMLALVSDFRYGLENARIGLPEVKIGIRVPAFIIQLLADVIGKNEAKEHVLLGDAYKTSEALEIGLLDELYSDPEKLKESVSKFAVKISKNSKEATAATKEAIRSLSTDLKATILLDLEKTFSNLKTKDAIEGVNAAVEGRRPNFN
ncbi:enoyl-CoA hydratase/isomerase family protein [Leptospira idonii]|uniref:Enoyl-CoA hydratase/isomerase family protein n=1 Tax=Leptospira idonii TaxID=1193500 RepID=A0A4R9LY60_9LEPT|nr:enoyl-CoA hydratase/isomerase family protein [Leptospira idonii]TGN18642.1 enoyl-CoA hydratase/isomerase family protein [Leptospira idonii]